MMKRQPILSLTFTVLLMLSSPLHADDSKVTDWTKQVLFATLSLNYSELDDFVDKDDILRFF